MDNAVSRLKNALNLSMADAEVKSIIESKDEVVSKYENIFRLENIEEIDSDTFYNFLLFSNNKHWGGLYRSGKQITNDMNKLKEVLSKLIDERIPISERISFALPGQKGRIKGLGKAVLTAILLVSQPEKYGVWNSTSEEGLKELNLWPNFERGESNGSKYEKINSVLLELAKNLEVDLWTLDALFWFITQHSTDTEKTESSKPLLQQQKPEMLEDKNNFRLEQQLQTFLKENWERIEYLKDWDIYEREGDVVGIEYSTNIGRIDILAHHKTESRWLVIELKREQTPDSTLGQVQRYMGWIAERLAEPNDSVEGLILAGSFTDKLKYGLKFSRGVKLMSYEVRFDLKTVE